MTMARITVADALCARAAGSQDVAAALRQHARDAEMVRTGCDGACWAQPLVTVTNADGATRRYERITPEDVDAILGGTGAINRAPTTPPPVGARFIAPPRSAAPATGDDASSAGDASITASDPFPGQTRRILRRCGVVDPESLADARRLGAYTALERARTITPEEVVALVKAANLRGRGGAYFPLAVKWESARANPAPRYLVVNAEEGEPGAFKDRHLMEGDPHLLLEGIAIAAHAAGCERVFLYINGQARLAAERMTRALADAEAEGVLRVDTRTAPSPWGERAGVRGGAQEAAHKLAETAPITVEIYRGAGGYVCGEESVILNSIEGERAVPRPRPPLPTDAGLWGRPTVISNVETLCNLPFIVNEGVEAFRAVGVEAYPGTKLVSLSGAVQRPGLLEVPIGITTRELIALGGDLHPGRTLRAVVMGGPSGGFLPPDLLDLPLTGGLVHPSGAVLGSGGVVVLDDRTPLSFALRELTAYNAAESCGKCTPCREGSERALAVLDRAAETGALSETERAELLELCDLMQYASLCGLGQMAPGPIRSALALFDQFASTRER